MQVTGQIERLQGEVSKLMAVFRDKLDGGRRFPATVSYFSVATEAGVTHDLLVNVFESRLLKKYGTVMCVLVVGHQNSTRPLE